MGWLSVFISILIGVIFIVLHLSFMVCIWKDGNRLEKGGRPTAVLTPFVGGLAALLTGLMAVGLYWVAHYSRFARKSEAAAR